MTTKFVCAKVNMGTCDKCPYYCSPEAFIKAFMEEHPEACVVHTVIPDGASLAGWNVWVNHIRVFVQTVRLADKEYAAEQQEAVNVAVRVIRAAGANGPVFVQKAVPQFERYGLSV